MTIDVRSLQGRPVIVGAGVAGLMTALELAPEPVVLLTAGTLGGEASSALAQGDSRQALATEILPNCI